MANISTSFSVFYDSEDLDSPLAHHSIDVAHLSTALAGISGILREANQIVNGSESRLGIRISAGGFEEGSFGIPIEILQDPLAIDILKAIGITVVNGAIILGGALGAIQKLKGRKINTVKRERKDGSYKLIVNDEVITCSQTEKKLVTNQKFRRHVEAVFSEPMEKTSADTIRLKIESEENGQHEESSLELSRASAQKFAAPEDLLQEEVEERDDIITVQFKSAFANKAGGWAVEHLGKTMKVTILDNAFLSKLNREDATFSFGRKFEVTLRETSIKKGGIGRASNSYSIVKVHREV